MMLAVVGHLLVTGNIEEEALLSTVASGSSWPPSWNSAVSPCAAGWGSFSSGWLGVRCSNHSNHSGLITHINVDYMQVSRMAVTGDVGNWSMLALAEEMCASDPHCRLLRYLNSIRLVQKYGQHEGFWQRERVGWGFASP